MYEYVLLTKVKNMFLWLMCFLWLPFLTLFLIDASVGPTFAVCVCAKVLLQILGN